MRQDKIKSEASSLGWLFLITMLVHVLCSLALNVLEQKGITFSIEASLIISELTVLVPSVIYVLVKKLSLSGDLGFRRIRIGTVLMSVLMTILVGPVAAFFNVLSQLFVSNTMVQMTDSLLEGSNVVVWLIGSVFGPFCEEFMCRGVFDNRYSLITSPLRAGLISALYFALAHLNLNQAAYAFVLGVIFSVINKAAGSLYPSMIIHMCINGWNLLLIMIMSALYDNSGYGQDLAQAAEAIRGSDTIYIMVAFTLVGAIICSLILIPFIVFVSKHENRYEAFREMFRGSHTKGRWLTFSSVLAICFTLFVMLGLEPLLSALSSR